VINMKDTCDRCGKELDEKELFSIEHWIEDGKKQRMNKTYMVAAFTWACAKCLFGENYK
jgi:hypothetical protein